MLTPLASRLRDWALFAAAALLPAVAVAVLGLRAVANEEAGGRREVAASLDAAAEREGARIERDLARASLVLGTWNVAPEPVGRAVTEIAPPYADAIVLDASRAVIYPPAPRAAPKAPASCDATARDLAISRDAAIRSRAEATLLASCAEAQDDAGRWLWPLVALETISKGAVHGEAIAAWLEAHQGQLEPTERDATRGDRSRFARRAGQDASDSRPRYSRFAAR